MLGDFLREAAVLVIVFYPLDRYFSLSSSPSQRLPDPVPVRRIIELSVLLLVTGMLLERVNFGSMALRSLDWVLRRLTAIREWLGKEEASSAVTQIRPMMVT